MHHDRQFRLDDMHYDCMVGLNKSNEYRVEIARKVTDGKETTVSKEEFAIHFLPSRVDIFDTEYESIIDRHQWIIDNLKDVWSWSKRWSIADDKEMVYFFRDKNDALLFKLRWG